MARLSKKLVMLALCAFRLLGCWLPLQTTHAKTSNAKTGPYRLLAAPRPAHAGSQRLAARLANRKATPATPLAGQRQQQFPASCLGAESPVEQRLQQSRIKRAELETKGPKQTCLDQACFRKQNLPT